jgi:uncharacterized protein YjeT (DUF2065 family)
MRDPLSPNELNQVGLVVLAVGCLAIWIASRLLR